MAKHFDVAIVGGGIVGRCLVGALKKGAATRHLRVALIDSLPEPEAVEALTARATQPRRVSTLTVDNYAFVSSLIEEGAAREAFHRHSQRFSRMLVWQGDKLGKEVLSFGEAGDHPAMGHVVDNNLLISALHWSYPGDVATFSRCKATISPRVASQPGDLQGGRGALNGPHVEVQVSPSESITCALLIGADGKDSIVRAFVKAPSVDRAYGQSAVVATLRVATAFCEGASAAEQAQTAKTAFQRFLPTGPIALLPLLNGHFSIVWTLESATLQALVGANASADTWRRLIAAALHLPVADVQYFLSNASRISDLLTEDEYKWRATNASSDHQALSGRIPAVGELVDFATAPLATFPLTLSVAMQTVFDRAILVGDAAHVIHPLAGQGVNMGINDVRHLSRAIGEVCSLGGDVGAASAFKAYQRRRLAATVALASSVDAIQRIFCSDPLPHGTPPSLLDTAIHRSKAVLSSVGMFLFTRLPSARQISQAVINKHL